MSDKGAKCTIDTSAEKGKTIRLVKYSVFCDSRKSDDCRSDAKEEMIRALSKTVDKLYKGQIKYMNKYWENCYISIKGDDELSQALAFNMYQLNQSVSKDGYGNIAPKGLSGDGYEGQYFWDTEMFMQPFFRVTNPEISKALIESRYMQLEKAKQNARIMGHALEIYVSILGSEAGNLALKSLPYAGVYIAGGIPGKIMPFIKNEIFVGSFKSKGRYRYLMEKFPVFAITDPYAALKGSAVCALTLQNK